MDSGASAGIFIVGGLVLIFSIAGAIGAFGGKTARGRTQGVVTLFVLGLLCAGAGVWLLTSVASISQAELMQARAHLFFDGKDPRLVDAFISLAGTLSKVLFVVGAVDLCLGIGAAVRSSLGSPGAPTTSLSRSR